MSQHLQGELPVTVYEHIFDALRACVQNAGGAKVVGPKLWPTKTVDQARKDCLDCLNPNNDRKFDPQETFKVFELAKEAGFHAGFHYACDWIGYHRPAPVTPQQQAESLLERAADLARESRNVAQALERLHASGGLRALGGGKP